MLKNIWVQRHFLLFAGFVVTFPFSVRASNILMTILAAELALTRPSDALRCFNANRKLFLISSFIFFGIVTCWLYSPEPLKVLEKHLPLILLPLIFACADKDIIDRRLTLYFGYSVLAMTMISFTFGLYNFFHVDADSQVIVGDSFNQVVSPWNALTNKALMRPFIINPIYMSLYVSFALMIFFMSNLRRPLKILVISFLIVYQFLIGSRIGMAAFLVTSVFVGFQAARQHRRLVFVVLLGIVVASSVLIIANPVLKRRFFTDMTALAPPATVEGWNALNIRVAIWDCSLDLAADKPFFGYGTAGQYTPREKCYQERYTFFGPYGDNLNSHNQYLEYLLSGGLFLFSIFLFQMGHSLNIAFKQADGLHTAFLALFLITCLGESLLETQKGLVFFSFFNCYFLYRQYNSAVFSRLDGDHPKPIV
jgi:O-antigen ligase